MSYSADEQSEDGELKRSPPLSGNNQDELDFSLSEGDADTADSLDIKPPQAKLAARNRYDRARDAHHSRDRHHTHRDPEKRHREKYERTTREYRDKERYKDYYEQSYPVDKRYSEPSRSLRRDELKYDPRYSDHEKHRKDYEDGRREKRHYDRKERRKDLDEKTAADRALEDLRERLLDKRRTKEHEEHKKSSKRHKSRRENVAEPGEVVGDSKAYVKEIIDLSKSTDEVTKKHHKRDTQPKVEDEMTIKEREEQELRRLKLLEAEKYRQEAEARREKRERKRLHEEQREEAKKRRLEEEEEELKLMKLRAAALSNELTGVVTLSDNTDESEVEANESDESNHERRNDDDDTDRSNHSHSDDSDESSGSRRQDSDRESAPSDFNERSPTPERSKFERSRSATPRHSRSASSREQSPSPEKQPEENQEEKPEETVEEESVVEELPPYIPAIQGCRSVEEFQCLNRIEEGTYGVVYRARDKRTEEIVALKRLKMEKEKEGFPITSLREINTLLKGQHPNIVTVREIVVGSNMDKIFIVMDYVEHDLKSLMETMRNKKQGFMSGEVKCLLQQLLKAVAHLHDNWILHRDLKTSNLLLSHKGILKVGDFGLAREYGSPLKAYTSIVVTLWYRAPELLLCAKVYSTPIDMWSVGCIFAELLTMNALFPGKSEVDQLNRIFKDLGTPNEKIWPGYSKLPAVQKVAFSEYPMSQIRTKFSMLSELGISLLSKFLTYDPSQRISAEDALKHGYFTETPLPIDPAMFPTWPAKSELGHRKAMAASPKPPSGGGQYKKLGDGDDDSSIGFHMGTNAAKTMNETRRLVAMGGGFSLKF